MNRKREQAELLFQLGQLLGPMLKMAEDPDTYDSDERVRIFARYAAESGRFVKALMLFCYGEPGHSYQVQFAEANKAMVRVDFTVPTFGKFFFATIKNL